jgi:hypothetical protein
MSGLIYCSGPNWIHGLNNNPILDIAQKTNTAVFPPELERTSVYDEAGQLLSDEEGVQITELVWSIIGEAFKYSNEESASISPNMSLMDFFQAKVKNLKLDEATSKLVLQMAHIWGDYVGEPIERQSLKYCWLEECLDESMLPLVTPSFQSIFLTRQRKSFRSGYLQGYPRPRRRSGPNRSSHSPLHQSYIRLIHRLHRQSVCYRYNSN